jgi:hypothetical protein
MKDLRQFDRWRIVAGPDSAMRNDPATAEWSGAFQFKLDPAGQGFIVTASNGEGWDHVAVSCKDRTPTWEEMDRIARIFFKEGEVAMQLHLPRSDHINCHPYCLHMWRPHGTKRAIPLPPHEFV